MQVDFSEVNEDILLFMPAIQVLHFDVVHWQNATMDYYYMLHIFSYDGASVVHLCLTR